MCQEKEPNDVLLSMQRTDYYAMVKSTAQCTLINALSDNIFRNDLTIQIKRTLSTRKFTISVLL